jgi:hypothetical protein
MNVPARSSVRLPRLLFVVAMGTVGGVVLLVCLVYTVLVLRWGEEDAIQSARQAAQQAQQAQDEVQRAQEAQREAAHARVTVVVARTNVAALTPLKTEDFELREIPAEPVLPDALTSLNDLQGKVLQVPIARGQVIPTYIVQDQSEPVVSAEIVDAEIGPPHVTVGDTLSFVVTVKNTSDKALRTAGPAPGFTYEQNLSYLATTYQSATTVCARCDIGGPSTLGAWRVAVGSTASDGIDLLPYRWGFGSELAPGATTTIRGEIRITRYFEPTHFWLALVQEPNRVVRTGAGMTVITSLPAPEDGAT